MAGFDLPRHVGMGAAVPLARRNLLDDKKRLIRSASGIGFAVFLMLVQLGFQAAFANSSVELIRHFDGELVIMSSAKYHIGHKAPFSRRQLYQARAVHGVASARPLFAEWNRSSWKNPQDQEISNIQVIAFDPDQPVLLFPEISRNLDALRQPDTVMMDGRSRRFLGQPAVGIETELGRRNVRIVGNFVLGPDFVVDGTVVMSDRNFAKLFAGAGAAKAAVAVNNLTEGPEVEFGIVKVTPDVSVALVKEALRSQLPPNITVLTRQELVDREKAWQAQFSGVGPIFGVGTLIGFAIGIMITYQILFEDVSNRLAQYATLKAIGYTNVYLVKVVLQQAVFYSVVGFLPAVFVCAALFELIGEIVLLPLRITLSLALLSFFLTLAMCVIAGLAAIRHVIRADPAELF